jgi:peptidoglycan/xylan/chitin deacetylase (PgdA/CDA1 family)
LRLIGALGERLNRRRFLQEAGAAGLAVSGLALSGGTARAQAPSRRVECPILTYHEVPNRARFAQQVAQRLQSGYQPISLDQLYRLLSGEEVPLWGRPFLLTFDDGLRSQRTNALPVLLDWQVPAVFAVMPDWRGDRVHAYMTNDDFRVLVQDHGMEVISHTLNHATVTRERLRNPGGWQAEIVESKRRLEEIVGDDYTVQGFCYPNGAYDAPTLDLVRQHYAIALTTRPGIVQTTADLLTLRRTSIT